MESITEEEKEKLLEFAELEGCETGEAIQVLLPLHNYRGYLADDFILALEIELKRLLNEFKEHYIIVEDEVTLTHKFKELERID